MTSSPADATTPSALSNEDAARIASRYPLPRGRRLLVLGCIALATIGIVWMVWSGMHSANKPVAARIEHFTVVSDTQINFVVRVQRANPHQAAVCTVSAQGQDGTTVGSVEATLPPGDQQTQEYPVTVKTVQRAVTGAVDNCR